MGLGAEKEEEQLPTYIYGGKAMVAIKHGRFAWEVGVFDQDAVAAVVGGKDMAQSCLAIYFGLLTSTPETDRLLLRLLVHLS